MRNFLRHLPIISVCSIIAFAQSAAAQTAPSAPAAPAAQPQTNAAPAPQTPRQALIEILSAKDSAALEKHLPDVLKAKLKQLVPAMFGGGGGFGVGVNGGWLQTVEANGMKVEIEQAGPVLLRLEDARTHQKTEIAFDDDLAGDEDDATLSFRVYKDGAEQAHWFDPKITLHMQQEQSIWKIMEIGFSAKLPLGDEDFLDAMAKSFQNERRQTGEMFGRLAVEQINRSEAEYLNKYGTYACSLDVLAKALRNPGLEPAYDPVTVQLNNAKENGYVVKLSGCSGAGYSLTASPVGGAGKAFCSDESGKLRYSDDGKAESCINSGQQVKESTPGITIANPR